MREIKFRAWEKPSEMVISMGYKPELVYGTGIFEDGINTWLVQHEKGFPMASGVFGGLLSDGSHGKMSVINPNTIGQFTCLYDKNGKEIYEGDIVSAGDNYPSIIQWNDKEAKFELFEKYPRKGRYAEKYDRFHEIPAYTDGLGEIIGNIYENSDLLGKLR